TLEQRIVAERSILSFAELRQRDRALAQALQRQKIDVAMLRKNAGRFEPIAREPGAASDPERFAHGGASRRLQSPCKPWISGKKSSFHDAGFDLIEPILFMNSAVL